MGRPFTKENHQFLLIRYSIVVNQLTRLFELSHVKTLLTRVNPLSGNPTKWSNTLKKFVGNSR